MESSAQIVKKIHRELGLGGAFWFLWGISSAIGQWLNIDRLKPPQGGAVYWFVFGGLLVSGIFLLECVGALLAGIREGAASINGAGRPDMWS